MQKEKKKSPLGYLVYVLVLLLTLFLLSYWVGGTIQRGDQAGFLFYLMLFWVGVYLYWDRRVARSCPWTVRMFLRALVVVVLLFPPLSTLVAVPNPFESLSLELLVLLLGYESITFVGDALHPPKEQK